MTSSCDGDSYRSYQRTLIVSASQADAYQALTTGIGRWWTEPSAPVAAVGSLVKFAFAERETFWTFRVKTLVPNQQVVMECVEARHVHHDLSPSIEKEWLATRLKWSIQRQATETCISFEHSGLTPALRCYAVCEAGWDFYFVESLRDYLNTGTGSPHR